MNMTTKLRLVTERILSRAIPNDVAFEISDIGRNRDIDDYQIPISPFERYWVDPSEINKMTGRRWKPWSNRRELLGEVRDGEWDERPHRHLKEKITLSTFQIMISILRIKATLKMELIQKKPNSTGVECVKVNPKNIC